MQWQNCIASVSYQQLPSLRINTKLIYRAVKTFKQISRGNSEKFITTKAMSSVMCQSLTFCYSASIYYHIIVC